MGQALFDEVVGMAYQQDLLSDYHFTVDGTLIEAAAGFKTFRPWDEEAMPVDEDDDPGRPNPVPAPSPSGCCVGNRPDPGHRLLRPAVLGHQRRQKTERRLARGRLTTAPVYASDRACQRTPVGITSVCSPRAMVSAVARMLWKSCSGS